MSTFTNMMAASAASNAASANVAANAARNAAEERLEGSSRMVLFNVAKLEKVDEPTTKTGFFSWLTSNPLHKIKQLNERVSIKNTDISHLNEKVDDFNNKFVEVVTESRSHLDTFYVFDTLENVTDLINGVKK